MTQLDLSDHTITELVEVLYADARYGGEIDGLIAMAKVFRERAGEHFANDKDDMAKVYRGLARELESDYEEKLYIYKQERNQVANLIFCLLGEFQEKLDKYEAEVKDEQ